MKAGRYRGFECLELKPGKVIAINGNKDVLIAKSWDQIEKEIDKWLRSPAIPIPDEYYERRHRLPLGNLRVRRL